jgi:hypothetical protein
VAEGPVPGKIGESSELEHVNPKLTFLGIAAFIDPLRPDVNEAVQTCTLKISTYLTAALGPDLHSWYL